MPRYFATQSIVSVESHPFSSCAMMSALITADCFWSRGYFATSRSIFFRESVVNIQDPKSGTDHVFPRPAHSRARKTWSVPVFGVFGSSVNLPEDDVLRAD